MSTLLIPFLLTLDLRLQSLQELVRTNIRYSYKYAKNTEAHDT